MFDGCRKLENPSQDQEARDEKRRRLFLLYTLASFGCPALVTVITVVLQLLEDDLTGPAHAPRYT
jgi:hypothetical protein